MALEVAGTNNMAVCDHQNGKSPSLTTPQDSSNHHHILPHYSKLHLQAPKLVIIFAIVAFSCLLLYHSSPYAQFQAYNPFSAVKLGTNPENKLFYQENKLDELKNILERATTSDKTILLTTINDAWTEPNSMFDMLLESFHIGNQTERFLKHLVVVALDEKAYVRCLKLHSHCYHLSINETDFSEEAYFMTDDYLKLVWRKIDYMHTILEFGYNFLFTDADIMWFRDPFPHFHGDGDIQVACDHFRGNPTDLNNLPNTGFTYVKSNNKTIQFYKFWYDSRLTYPHLHDQDVFNMIKFDPFILENGLQIRFLDTSYFGGFCELSRDFDKVCTMHANCCVGLGNKVHDIGIMLQDWRKYVNSFVNQTAMLDSASWTVPQSCRGSFQRAHLPKKKGDHGSKS